MSKFILGIGNFFISFLGFCKEVHIRKNQKKLYSIVKQIKTFEWYKSAAEQWGEI